jgi:peptidoglycan/xylan/chitin deacetylase (PgdA/CDA1 family)
LQRRSSFILDNVALAAATILRPGFVVRRLSRRYPDVLFRHPTLERVVALTFDDSPHSTLTPRILNALAEYDARATFFAIGSKIPGNEDILRRLAAEGHELGNHMMEDAPSHRLSPDEFERQLFQTHALLEPYGGARWFRPGHGWFNRRMLEQVHRRGYRCAMASTYAYEFLTSLSGDCEARQILLNVRPGAVIVIHDGAEDRERTVVALRRMMPALRDRGYRVVTLSTLVEVGR